MSTDTSIIDPMESIICIPGNWKDQAELVTSIVKATEGQYFYAALFLMDTKKKQSFNLEICDRDERMKEAFTWAGKATRISDETLEAIGEHRYVAYLSGETGSYQTAEAIARAAGALLKAGGLGVKIETAGKAFDKETWLHYLENFESYDLYDMFVVDSIGRDDGTIYSCGMHNLGLKDTIVYGEALQDAVNLIRVFSFYQIVDAPDIHAGETFTATIDAPTYRISEELLQPYAGDKTFANPFGMWKLQRR